MISNISNRKVLAPLGTSESQILDSRISVSI